MPKPDSYTKLTDDIMAMASTFREMFKDDAELADFLAWLVEHADRTPLATQIASCGIMTALSLLAIGGAAAIVLRWFPAA